MNAFRRYAIYWMPQTGGDLARLGAAWIGRDAETGQAVPQPDLAGLPQPAGEITRNARRYGFHATLKPPFRLAAGTYAASLSAATAMLADTVAPFDIPGLVVAPMGQFLALRPALPCPELDALAAASVRSLDRFRAPASDAEMNSRRAVGLSPGQEKALCRWGYPYVMEEFRFHITLTGPLDPAEAAAVAPILADWFAPALAGPVPVRDIALMGEDAAGAFHVLRQFPLRGQGTR